MSMHTCMALKFFGKTIKPVEYPLADKKATKIGSLSVWLYCQHMKHDTWYWELRVQDSSTNAYTQDAVCASWYVAYIRGPADKKPDVSSEYVFTKVQIGLRSVEKQMIEKLKEFQTYSKRLLRTLKK